MIKIKKHSNSLVFSNIGSETERTLKALHEEKHNQTFIIIILPALYSPTIHWTETYYSNTSDLL